MRKGPNGDGEIGDGETEEGGSKISNLAGLSVMEWPL